MFKVIVNSVTKDVSQRFTNAKVSKVSILPLSKWIGRKFSVKIEEIEIFKEIVEIER